MAILLVALLHSVASAQIAADSNCAMPGIESGADLKAVVPVAFPGVVKPVGMLASPISVPAAAAPVPAPAPVMRPPVSAQPAKATLMISRMNGEVHFKHLGGPRVEPSRALQIETGGTQSWCEFKMNSCTGRIWKDSEVTILPDSSTILLKKGSLIVSVKGEGGKYSIICGDLLYRADATTVRVQRTENNVSFQVLEGTVTVCNKATGEIFTAAQVVQPIR